MKTARTAIFTPKQLGQTRTNADSVYPFRTTTVPHNTISKTHTLNHYISLDINN
jgi:hypothetical protein